jgi:hypothetical protein
MRRYLRFADIKARGLFNNRQSLRNAQKKPKPGWPPFPLGRLIGPNTRIFTEEELDAYVAACPTKPKPAPVVKKGRHGRPRKAEPSIATPTT